MEPVTKMQEPCTDSHPDVSGWGLAIVRQIQLAAPLCKCSLCKMIDYVFLNSTPCTTIHQMSDSLHLINRLWRRVQEGCLTQEYLTSGPARQQHQQE